MKAVVYKGNGQIVLEEHSLPKLIEETDAIVKVTLTTICSSDIHIRHGAVPRAVPGVILGHEFVGVVEETGSAVKNVRPGDRVVVNVETFCGECFFCKKGFVNNCTDKEGGWALGCRIDGGQAEYVRIPHAAQGLTKIPDNVTDEQALFTGDLLSTGFWAAQMAEIEPGDTVAVIGAGPTGMCAMMAARLYHPGCIAAVDIDQERLNMARKNKLADIAVNSGSEDVYEQIAALTGGRGADRVIEAAGGTNTFEMAWRIARPNAVVGLVAMYEENQILPLPQMYGKNLIFKTGGVDANSCSEILRLISEGSLDARCLITHKGRLEDIMEAYRIFENREDGVIKWAIRP